MEKVLFIKKWEVKVCVSLSSSKHPKVRCDCVATQHCTPAHSHNSSSFFNPSTRGWQSQTRSNLTHGGKKFVYFATVKYSVCRQTDGHLFSLNILVPTLAIRNSSTKQWINCFANDPLIICVPLNPWGHNLRNPIKFEEAVENQEWGGK